jgi:hypothetical protein
LLPADTGTQLAFWKLLDGASAKDTPFDSSRINLLILLRRARLGQEVFAGSFQLFKSLEISEVH